MVHEQRTAWMGRVIRFLEAGLGRPLVLLHAFPASADMWRPQLERVPRGWRFIAPDFRGFGGSTLDDDPVVSMNDYASDILGLMDSLQIGRAVVGGLSMGGYVTFAVFRRAPERVSGLLLADTKATADSEEALQARHAMLDTVRDKGVGAIADEMVGKLLGETSRRDRPAVVAEVRRLIAGSSQAGVEAAIYALMTRPDSTPDLALIDRPALIVVGEEDTVTPVAESESMQRSIRGSQLAIVPRAGHLSNLEAPEEFSHTIAGWVASLPHQ
jgi:3-oxoadipate enol-lactonase